jgi:hypothetical protein
MVRERFALLGNSRPAMAAGVVLFFAIHGGLSKPA